MDYKKLKNVGVLKLSAIYIYLTANRLQYISKWFKDDSFMNKIEEIYMSKEINLPSLPFIGCLIRQCAGLRSTNVSTTLTAWWEFFKLLKSSFIPSRLPPF